MLEQVSSDCKFFLTLANHVVMVTTAVSKGSVISNTLNIRYCSGNTGNTVMLTFFEK